MSISAWKERNVSVPTLSANFGTGRKQPAEKNSQARAARFGRFELLKRFELLAQGSTPWQALRTYCNTMRWV
jgi:hypothetical protein